MEIEIERITMEKEEKKGKCQRKDLEKVQNPVEKFSDVFIWLAATGGLHGIELILRIDTEL